MATSEENTQMPPTEERHHHRRLRRTRRSCRRSPHHRRRHSSLPIVARDREQRCRSTKLPIFSIASSNYKTRPSTRRIRPTLYGSGPWRRATVAFDHGSGSIVVHLAGACVALGRQLGSGGWVSRRLGTVAGRVGVMMAWSDGAGPSPSAMAVEVDDGGR
ncbi:hypothetical protein Dimus_015912, partial [Dionaea muscipula]